jgi:hypothetical protein
MTGGGEGFRDKARRSKCFTAETQRPQRKPKRLNTEFTEKVIEGTEKANKHEARTRWLMNR